jgi:hypothetical protein
VGTSRELIARSSRRSRIERAEVTTDERRVPGVLLVFLDDARCTTSISYLGRRVRRRDAETVLYSGVSAPQSTSPAGLTNSHTFLAS